MAPPLANHEPHDFLSIEASRLAEEMWITLNRGGQPSGTDPWQLMEQAVAAR